ncbi:MAG: glucose 1-dehydrogenase [Deltaproteobacteria bacterium]|nr:glucose 1-dehydrogenase [Deltaproteobacteria bacterium]
MKLNHKVAIITGAARSIGRGIALKFASEGALIVIADILMDKAQEVVEEIKQRGGKAVAFHTDVSQKADVADLVKYTKNNFKAIHILINNAAIIPPSTSIIDMAEEQWDRVLDVNLKGVFLCTQAVLRHMMEQRYGKIINISSIGGIGYPLKGSAHYASAKAGIVMLTKNTAIESGSYGVNVNAIAPGLISTGKHHYISDKKEAEKRKKENLKSIILGRLGTPEDIANLALFLASDDASYLTGQIISCNGGFMRAMS